LDPEEQKPVPIFSRTQIVILLVLACALAAGLFLFKHRRMTGAQDITLVAGSEAAYELKVDINSATWQEIALIPGVGQKRAQAIVAYREKNGPFRSAEDLTRVSGVGRETAADIARYARLREASD
jgi:competence protein ComEA